MIRLSIFLMSFTTVNSTFCQYAPGAGQIGTSAVFKDSSIFINWASEVVSFDPGPEDLSNSQSATVSFGIPQNALGQSEGNSFDAISLGDNGSITVGFEFPIMNSIGPDFAVFENSFSDTYLELAFVEVSTNGSDYVRFPATSNTQTSSQTGAFDSSDPTLINNLAGKYRQGFGVPFDLAELSDSTKVNIDSINYIRIVDAVGSIDSTFGTFDSNGNFINDPFPSPFNSSGFDLDAVGVIHQNNPLTSSDYKPKLFRIYPNPAQNSFTIKNSLANETYSVFNLQGQLVLETNGNSKIDCSALENGIYLIKLNSEENQQIERLFIRH
ncbi:MAG: T9SS type A sorting domain-containing protein [Crocinitomicaceae bacterium]